MAKRKDQSAKGPAWRAAEDYGIDMSLIEANLRKTPAERIRANSLAVASDLALRKAVRNRNSGSR